MKIEDDMVIFSTGKKAYAHFGIIGLSPDLEIYDGYDGSFSPPSSRKLTPDEQIELAEFMISQWEAFKLSIRR